MMKKIILSLILTTLGLSTQAQFYKFSYRTETYQEFNDGQTVIPELDSVSADYSLTEFKLFDKPTVSTWSVSVYGFMICKTADDAFALDPCIASMKKRDVNSSVTAKTETINGELVHKIQWKNMGFYWHDPGDYINFQVWIYTDQQMVEYHYGPSIVTSDSALEGGGAQILIGHLTPDFQAVRQIYAVMGSGANPVAVFNGFDLYTGVPSENLVFRFYNAQLSSVLSKDVFEVKVYPNPFKNMITIEGELDGTETIILRGVDGREVIKVVGIGVQRVFDTESLDRGVYFIEVIGNNRRYTTKLVK